jgi:hypothetical protein
MPFSGTCLLNRRLSIDANRAIEEVYRLGAYAYFVKHTLQFYAGNGSNHGSFECEPSQKGIVFECLQAHHATVPGSLISVFSGSRPVPLCEPSQNGWLLDRPHAHHQ